MGKDDEKLKIPELQQDFSQEREVLTRKPLIEYEPPLSDIDEPYMEPEIEDETLEETQQRIKDLVNGYKKVEDFSNTVEEMIDKKVGNYSISLDPKKDSHVIDAIGRCFPEAKDKTKITYQMYKKCLANRSEAAKNVPSISYEDMLEAQRDPTRTDFGSMNIPSGLVSNPADGIIEPVDLDEYKKSGIAELFKMLQPKIIEEIIRQIGKLTPFG